MNLCVTAATATEQRIIRAAVYGCAYVERQSFIFIISSGGNGCQTEWNRYRKTTPIIYHHLRIPKRSSGTHYSNLIEIVAVRRLSTSGGWRQEDEERISLIEKMLNNWQIKCVASRLSTFYDFLFHTPRYNSIAPIPNTKYHFPRKLCARMFLLSREFNFIFGKFSRHTLCWWCGKYYRCVDE